MNAETDGKNEINFSGIISPEVKIVLQTLKVNIMPKAKRKDNVKVMSFKLTAYSGYGTNGQQKRKSKTWQPNTPMSDKQAQKEADRQALLFEDSINFGASAFDGTIKF
jgi:hypothetical protein